MAYRPTDRTRARAAAARERIVSAALDQLAEGGYASASMAAVARRAGVATGSVYRHFPSKGDLFAEAFRRASQREVDVLVALGHRTMPVRERLAAWVHAFVHRALAEPVRAYALIAEPVDPAVEAERLTLPARLRRPLRPRCALAERCRTRTPRSPRRRSSAASPRRWSGRCARRDADADELAAALTDFVLSAVGATRVAELSLSRSSTSPSRSRTSTCSRPTCRCRRRSSARAAGWAVDRVRDCGARGRLGRGAGARPPRRAQRAAAAHPRPLRPPHRPGRARPELALAAARRASSARSTRCRGATRGRARTSRARRSSCCGRRPTPGVMCPVSMTYSAVPALRVGPGARGRVGAAADAARLRARRAVRDGDDREAGRLGRAREHHARRGRRRRLVGAAPATSGSAPIRRATSSSCSRRRPAASPASCSSAGPGWSSSG